nr:hypothetical protein MACL_00000379 [Theileria orientalis]
MYYIKNLTQRLSLYKKVKYKYNNDNLLQYAHILNKDFKKLQRRANTKLINECSIYYKDENLSNLSQLIGDSVKIIINSFNKFGQSNVYLSFNGGKDSVVALHLYRIASHEFAAENKGHDLQAVYFKDPSANEFDEITGFIHTITSKYGLNLRVVEDTWERGVKLFQNSSFILGSRSMDEGCGDLKPLEAGDADDFEFFRINPILNWTYGDVWNFLLYFQLEYCSLYDKGYTSIGTVNDTLPNPYLKSGDTYLPAYKLTQWEYERCSRVKH